MNGVREVIRNKHMVYPHPKRVKDLLSTWMLHIIASITIPPENNYVGIAYSGIYKTYVVLKILIHDTHEAEASKYSMVVGA
jgi:hypothetical protein